MLSRISRAFVGLMMWLFIYACFSVLEVVVMLSNYLGCVSSFYLSNFSQIPLWMDELLGLFFDVFLGEATVAHLLSLGITCVIAAGWFLGTYIVFDIFRLLRDREEYLIQEDEISARLARRKIIEDAVILAILAIPMYLACKWDIGLWQYRGAAAALGINDPLSAVNQVPEWKSFLDDYGHLYAPIAIRFGGHGYIAVTALVSIGLAIATKYVGEFWHKLLQAFSDLWNLDSDDPDDPNGPNDPIQPEAEADLGYPVPRDPEPEGQNENPPDEPQEVIGGNGEQVTIADALNNERYWIDPVTREIWDADHRSSYFD